MDLCGDWGRVMQQRVVIIGAGVVGVLSAYALATRGAKVTLIDSQPGPAEGCSRANAGILAVGHASAWASPSAIGSITRALLRREPGIRVTRPTDPALWAWGAQFLRNCTASAHATNTSKLQRLSRMSRNLTQKIEADLGLTGSLRHEGGLYLFQNLAQFRAHAATLAQGGARADDQMEVLDSDALIQRDPALATMPEHLAGGIYSPVDSVGNCHSFTKAVSEVIARKFDVALHFGTHVTGFETDGRTITGVKTDHGARAADAVLLATGTGTAALTRQLGFAPAIYPVKGYSGSWTIRDPDRIPRLPYVDETELLAVACYGGQLRVTAMAEFAGQSDLSLPDTRLDVLRAYVARQFGDAVDAHSASFWTGQRPSTPAGPPFLGRVRRWDNLWINAGHGQLGWTMAAGCGDVIARAMTAETPTLRDVSSTARWLDAL
ncbi:D-amino-acid dehydrogenase [Thioclava dalianensis]|nr:D-amino-acid dehydrogenase [Thioclava dalianensis]